MLDQSAVASGRRTCQINVKGSLVVRDCSEDGKCVTVENTSTKVTTPPASVFAHWAASYNRETSGIMTEQFVDTRSVTQATQGDRT